jgi:hypothetical protein
VSLVLFSGQAPGQSTGLPVTGFGEALAGMAGHDAEHVAERVAMPHQQDFFLWFRH